MSEFDLLKIIPGVHASIIGIFIAFFSAYFIFVYQKIIESQDDVDNFIKNIERPTLFILGLDLVNYHDPTNVYEEFSKSFYKTLDLYPQSSYLDNSVEDEINEIIKQLNDNWILYINTINYIYDDLGFMPSLTDFNKYDYLKKEKKFEDYSNIIEIFSAPFKIDNLINYSNSYNSIYKKIKIIKAHEHIKIDKNQCGEFYEMMNNQLLENINNMPNPIDYNTYLTFINKFKEFYHHQYPELVTRIKKSKDINETFKLKKYFLVCLSFFSIVMIFGILAPLFTIKCLSQSDLIFFNKFYITNSVVENIIVLISFSPYIGICLYSFFKFGFKKHQ